MQSSAYEITSEDVANVLRSNSLAVANTNGVSFQAMAEEILPSLNFELIEQAALCGDSLDEQTDYANDEIARQLREMGILEPLKSGPQREVPSPVVTSPTMQEETEFGSMQKAAPVDTNRDLRLLHAAVENYRELLLSPTSADRAALGDDWADQEARHCDAMLKLFARQEQQTDAAPIPGGRIGLLWVRNGIVKASDGVVCADLKPVLTALGEAFVSTGDQAFASAMDMVSCIIGIELDAHGSFVPSASSQ